MGVCAVMLVVLISVTWTATPSTSDVLARVEAVDHAHGTSALPAGAVPALLAEALVATEDESFYQNHGVNVEGIGRAALYDVVHRCKCQGGSSLTQQLVKDLYLGSNDRTLWRRWEDIVLAVKLDHHLSKPQVLAAYLSEVYLGHGAFGALQASQVYFQRTLAELTLAQAALLAGLPRDPGLYDPLAHPTMARARRADVLNAMVDNGFITSARARAAGKAAV
jgi:penicillin-binding protein 1A